MHCNLVTAGRGESRSGLLLAKFVLGAGLTSLGRVCTVVFLGGRGVHVITVKSDDFFSRLIHFNTL